MIGLCIRYFNPNYGGMLQGVATMKLLEKRNLDYQLIRYEKKRNAAFFVRAIPRLFNPVLQYEKKLLLSKKINAYLHPEFKRNEQKRRKKFREFEKKYFTPKEQICYGYDALKEKALLYDTVITGSDQIWSPSGLESNFYNLMFVPDEVGKISLASSFGVSQIPEYQKKKTREYLQRIPYISMREEKGAEIVRQLTGKEVPVVLDPVFMLTKQEWEEYASKHSFCNEPYIFAYLLGASEEYRKEIKEYAHQKNLKIVTLRHANQYVKADECFGDYHFYDIGPCEFLNLIMNAQIICTDSYHGSVFSLLFHKEFIVFNRYADTAVYSKNSRIDTFCSTFKVESRHYGKNCTVGEMMQIPLDYSEIDKILNSKRRVFDGYLDQAIESEYSLKRGK